MLINENLKETVFNYCAQWSGADDQETDFSIIAICAMSHTKQRFPLEGMAFTKRNIHPQQRTCGGTSFR